MGIGYYICMDIGWFCLSDQYHGFVFPEDHRLGTEQDIGSRPCGRVCEKGKTKSPYQTSPADPYGQGKPVCIKDFFGRNENNDKQLFKESISMG